MPVSAAAIDLVPSQVKGSERNSALNRMDSQLVRVISNPHHWSYSEGKRKYLGLSKNKSGASAKPDVQRAAGGRQRGS